MSGSGSKSAPRPASSSEGSTAKVATEAAHTLFVESTTVLWMVYRNTLARPARMIVPEHTRDAFFQAFCDLRTNSPKDRKWLKRHLNALKPHTAKGWLALSAALMFVASGLTGLLCVVAALLTFLLYSTLFVSVIAGIATGTLLTVLSVTMMMAAGAAGACAACIGGGYTSLELASRVLALAHKHILKPASNQLPMSRRASADAEPAQAAGGFKSSPAPSPSGSLQSSADGFPMDAALSPHNQSDADSRLLQDPPKVGTGEVPLANGKLRPGSEFASAS